MKLKKYGFSNPKKNPYKEKLIKRAQNNKHTNLRKIIQHKLLAFHEFHKKKQEKSGGSYKVWQNPYFISVLTQSLQDKKEAKKLQRIVRIRKKSRKEISTDKIIETFKENIPEKYSWGHSEERDKIVVGYYISTDMVEETVYIYNSNPLRSKKKGKISKHTHNLSFSYLRDSSKLKKRKKNNRAGNKPIKKKIKRRIITIEYFNAKQLSTWLKKYFLIFFLF